MKTTFDAKRVALLLAILIILNVFRLDSASFQPHQATVFSGRNRMLRKLPSAPPPPQLSRANHFKFPYPRSKAHRPCPPPPKLPSAPPPPKLNQAPHLKLPYPPIALSSPPPPPSTLQIRDIAPPPLRRT
ncbi:hypothetical protein L1987_57740 [Smallanthus sonchifolius]|uniref:Uncharacterized protein n=1 Tax=Smallanthus sonchifolius TaxID=185202 RepID=A0ACB9DDW0_9ASTR|nr:hypothetical protein L1987_57740 [Smallanthus sonchifolius]